MSVDVIIAALVVIGGVFTLIGSFGLARLPDFYSRLHGPTKATTLGAGALITASMIHFSMKAGGLYLHEILIIVFLFLTAPVSAHLVARAALVRGVASVSAGDDEGDGHRRPDDEPGADLPQRGPTRPSPEPPEE